MNFQKIIQHAWLVTNSHPKLIWYGSIPAFISIVIGTVYLFYQGFAFWAYFNQYSVFSIVLQYSGRMVELLTANVSVTIGLIIVGVILVIAYIFVPIVLHGGLVKLLSKILFNKPIQYRTGIPLGMIYFFPLFNYNASIAPFSILSLIFTLFAILRNVELSTLLQFWPLIVLILLIDLVVMLFFTFAQYFIILENKRYLDAMKSSAKLVFLNVEATFFLMMLMMLIGMRIVLNILGVLIIPGLILAITYFFTGAIVQILSIWVGILGGFLGILFLSYLTGILNVFIATVWTMTFYTLLRTTAGFEDMLQEEAKMAE